MSTISKACSPKSSKRMDAALEHVRHELAGVRTGRASVTMLDSVHVEAYGSKMPLNQVAGAVGPRADADRRAAVRPVADRRDREGDPRRPTSASTRPTTAR